MGIKLKKYPVCTEKTVFERVRQQGEYTVYRCPICDVVFSEPMRALEAEWYKRSEMYAVGKVSRISVGWHHKQFLNDKMLYGKKLLDIGCGTGVFLNEARKKGYEVWGVDFDDQQVRIVKERYGLENVYTIDAREMLNIFSHVRFDVITFFEVLEHLEFPAQFIKNSKSLLNPKGYIALSVPNRERSLDTLGESDCLPHHLTKWNKECLIRFLERNGFEIVKCVMKKFDADEVAGYLKSKLRFGVSKTLAKRGIKVGRKSDILKAAILLEVKEVVFKMLTLPLTLFPFQGCMQGTTIYVLARLK